VQLATGVAMALGGVAPARAAGVAARFCDLMSCAPDGRRPAAAHLLTAAMKAIEPPSPPRPLGVAVVTAAGADINMAQPCAERAAAYAVAMTKTMPLTRVADCLAKASERVSRLHGAARDGSGLTSFSRCSLFDRPALPVDLAAGAAALLVACVRAAYTRDHVRDFASAALLAALAATPRVQPPKARRDAEPEGRGDPFMAVTCGERLGGDGERLSTDDKLAALWTFVHLDPACEVPPAVTMSGLKAEVDPADVRVIDGGPHLLSRSAQDNIARVKLLE